MVYVILEQAYYGGGAMPIALADTVEELSAFLKQREYYVGSHAQSVAAVTKALNADYCPFFWDTGSAGKMGAGSFKILKWAKDMKFRDKYTRADFEIEAPTI